MVVTASVLAQTTLFTCDFESDDCGAIYEDDSSGALWELNSFEGCPGAAMYHADGGWSADLDYVVWGPFTIPSAEYMQLNYDLTNHGSDFAIYYICDTYVDPNDDIGSWNLLAGPFSDAMTCVEQTVCLIILKSYTISATHQLPQAHQHSSTAFDHPSL